MIDQVTHTLKVFEHTHPDCVGIFIFDRSSAHEGFAENALNVNNMNIKHGGKQRKLRDTVIPLSNPDPASGEDDTCGQVQKMCFLDDHPNPGLRGQPKGIKVVLQEWKSVWDKYIMICKERDMKDVGKCLVCSKSEIYKDAERRVMFAEAVGEATSSADEKTVAGTETPPASDDMWCCMQRVLSLQEDFQAERPLIQMLIEDLGHICLFLPRFHCKLNLIEMLWGYGKYCACISLDRAVLASPLLSGYRTLADGRFATAKTLVPKCLNLCELTMIRKFFQKSWRYLDAYQNGLNARQAALANKKYKSHRKVGLPKDIIDSADAKRHVK